MVSYYQSQLDQSNPVRVFIACSGLGRIKRGFESFTRECFDALVKEPSIKITLFKGAGDYQEKEVVLWNLPRNDWRAIQLSKLTARSDYNIEQSTFFLSLIPHIHRENPDIIYFSDINLGYALWHWRRLTKKRYKLLFSNGCPQEPPFPRWDYIQQLTPFEFQRALDAGVPVEQQSMIPYGFNISSQLQIITPIEKKVLRSQLRLPEDKPLILSVGLIDKTHKRMDYLIREVARLTEPRPFLLLLGQKDTKSSEVTNLGIKLLGLNNFETRTVDQHEIHNYYKIADIFVLASLREAFGRVFLEAISHGLPCLAHDYAVTQYILGENGYLSNLKLEGNLANLIRQVLGEAESEYKIHIRHRNTYEQFSWDKLSPRYIDMITKCAMSNKII
jgi:1,2-diacylglycerol 3-alpha-glucosyltransferase